VVVALGLLAAMILPARGNGLSMFGAARHGAGT